MTGDQRALTEPPPLHLLLAYLLGKASQHLLTHCKRSFMFWTLSIRRQHIICNPRPDCWTKTTQKDTGFLPVAPSAACQVLRGFLLFKSCSSSYSFRRPSNVGHGCRLHGAEVFDAIFSTPFLDDGFNLFSLHLWASSGDATKCQIPCWPTSGGGE